MLSTMQTLGLSVFLLSAVLGIFYVPGAFALPSIGACIWGPCKNNGTCQNANITSYVCYCLPGFSGINCQEDALGTTRDPGSVNGTGTTRQGGGVIGVETTTKFGSGAKARTTTKASVVSQVRATRGTGGIMRPPVGNSGGVNNFNFGNWKFTWNGGKDKPGPGHGGDTGDTGGTGDPGGDPPGGDPPGGDPPGGGDY